MKPHRYSVIRAIEQHDYEPPHWEVRQNAQGTSDDWDSGIWFGTFDSREEAEQFAHQLRTLSLKECPRCLRGLSCTSYEQYCAYDDCLWNNPQS